MSNVVQQKRPKIRGVADIVFCFDCTFSMQPCIDQVKNNVQTFVHEINNQPQTVIDWRVRAMGYRDFNFDAEKIINHFPFVNDVASFTNQLAQLRAEGGDDLPESTLDALWYALKETKWRDKCHKVIVLFTDDDTLPVHKDTIARFNIVGDVDYLVQELMVNKISLFMFAKSCDAYDMFHSLPKNSKIMMYPNPRDDFKNADFKDILSMIAKTISQTVSARVF